MTNPLSRLKSICDGATDGPWEFASSFDLRRGSVFVEDRALICDYGPSDLYGKTKHTKVNNFKFIATARTAMPLLIEIVEKQREALEATAVWDYPEQFRGMDNKQIEWAFLTARQALQETAKLLEKLNQGE